eukprot:1346507-Pyramimonas_sp.AAC.1
MASRVGPPPHLSSPEASQMLRYRLNTHSAHPGPAGPPILQKGPTRAALDYTQSLRSATPKRLRWPQDGPTGLQDAPR